MPNSIFNLFKQNMFPIRNLLIKNLKLFELQENLLAADKYLKKNTCKFVLILIIFMKHVYYERYLLVQLSK